LVKQYFCIGDKNTIAIEFTIENVQPYVVGYNRLWLNGEYLGCWEDLSMLGTVVYSLCDLNLKHDTADAELNDIYIEFEKEIFSLETFCIDETYDDFAKIIIKQKDEYVFLWKLFRNSYFVYPNYSNNVKMARVKIQEYNDVMDVFKKIISCFASF